MLSKVLGREELGKEHQGAWEKLKKEYNLRESFNLNEGGAAGHMAHPFDLPNVNTGRDLIKSFEQAANSLKKEPGAVKIDGVNASIRLINLEGKRELAKTSKYWANYCTVYLDGQEGELDGTVFNNYTIIDKLPEGVRLIGCGLDFGYTNDPTSLVAIYKWNDKYILSELLYETGMLNSTIANYIKNNVDINRYPIIADSAEPKSIAEIRSRGINIKGVKKGKGSIDYGIGLMQEHELVILSSATNIINEFKKYTWAKDRDGNATNKPIDNYNHSIDAIRYLFMELISKTKAPFGYDII